MRSGKQTGVAGSLRRAQKGERGRSSPRLSLRSVNTWGSLNPLPSGEMETLKAFNKRSGRIGFVFNHFHGRKEGNCKDTRRRGKAREGWVESAAARTQCPLASVALVPAPWTQKELDRLQSSVQVLCDRRR